jgi:hypothetical protein
MYTHNKHYILHVSTESYPLICSHLKEYNRNRPMSLLVFRQSQEKRRHNDLRIKRHLEICKLPINVKKE